MKVIFHPTYGMNIDIQLSTNARNVSPQFGPEFALDGFVPPFRTEYHMHHVLRVGMGHVPHLRCSASYIPRTQRLRAGLTYAAPPALERGRAGTARRKGGGHGIPAAARNLRCRAPTRTAAEGGTFLRRDLSRR